MIPIGDDVPGERFPFVTYGLIAVNVFVFLLELTLGPQLELFFRQWGVVPAQLVAHWQSPAVLLTVFTSMYLHGGWWHLIGNMLYLWIFGNNVEDRMGHLGYFVFYTLCGVLAALAQVAVDPSSRVPSVGASGAIAGVLGAYLLLYPHARVYVLIPLFLIFTTVAVPAVIVLVSWFLVQLFNGVAGLAVMTAQTGGVAFWAHIGGFLAGMVLMPFFRQKRRLPYRYVYGTDRYRPDSSWWQNRY